MMKTLITIGCSLAAIAMAVPASAEVFNFTTSGNPTNNENNGITAADFGNVRSYTVNGIKVQASAYSYNGSTLNKAYLGQYDEGLGVINAVGQSDDDSHTIDNSGWKDFVLLVFNQNVNISGGILYPFQLNGATDNDAWVGWGNLTNAYDTASPIESLATGNSIFGTLTSASNGKRVEGCMTNCGSSPYLTNFNTNPTTNTGNVWMISAARNETFNQGTTDAFKLKQVTVSAAVPEPATWAMMIGGFGAVGMAMRRRRAVAVRIGFAA